MFYLSEYTSHLSSLLNLIVWVTVVHLLLSTILDRNTQVCSVKTPILATRHSENLLRLRTIIY